MSAIRVAEWFLIGMHTSADGVNVEVVIAVVSKLLLGLINLTVVLPLSITANPSVDKWKIFITC